MLAEWGLNSQLHLKTTKLYFNYKFHIGNLVWWSPDCIGLMGYWRWLISCLAWCLHLSSWGSWHFTKCSGSYVDISGTSVVYYLLSKLKSASISPQMKVLSQSAELLHLLVSQKAEKKSTKRSELKTKPSAKKDRPLSEKRERSVGDKKEKPCDKMELVGLRSGAKCEKSKEHKKKEHSHKELHKRSEEKKALTEDVESGEKVRVKEEPTLKMRAFIKLMEQVRIRPPCFKAICFFSLSNLCIIKCPFLCCIPSISGCWVFSSSVFYWYSLLTFQCLCCWYKLDLWCLVLCA